MRIARITLMAVVTCLSPVTAQETVSPAVDSLLRANRYAIDFHDGVMSGPGAEFLRGATANAQFVMIGEFHKGAETRRSR